MSKKILVVDDDVKNDSTFLPILKKGLEPLGFEVIGEASSNETTITDKISKEHPQAVLLDINFDGKPLGKHLLSVLKTAHPQLPVFMMTATMEDPDYNPDDYQEAEFRYAKDLHEDGDFSSLKNELNFHINKTVKIWEEKLQAKGFVVGKSQRMQELLAQMAQYGDLDSNDLTILIQGETGTGKELVAQALHYQSNRARSPFVDFSCADISGQTAESELFGHVKGAFTGATFNKNGLFVTADNGTIFLDEIGELSVELQAKLLRVLQEKKVKPMGATRNVDVNARVVAATNRDLQEMYSKGTFKKDLYMRMKTILLVPPLRERLEDIEELFKVLVTKVKERTGKAVKPVLKPDVADLLKSYHWPGNIRELENVIEKAVVEAKDSILGVRNFQSYFDSCNGYKKSGLKGPTTVDKKEKIVAAPRPIDNQEKYDISCGDLDLCEEVLRMDIDRVAGGKELYHKRKTGRLPKLDTRSDDGYRQEIPSFLQTDYIVKAVEQTGEELASEKWPRIMGWYLTDAKKNKPSWLKTL